MPTSKRILLGHIRGAHGIRGDVSVQSYTADPEAIADYGPLFDESGRRSFAIQHVRATAKGLVVHLEGVDDRTAAEGLRGTALYVPREALPTPAEGDYYHADLVGLAACDVAGAILGEIVAVQNFGAGDLLEVRLTGAKSTEFIPFTDACVPTVDIAARRVVIVPPPTIDGDAPEAEDGNPAH